MILRRLTAIALTLVTTSLVRRGMAWRSSGRSNAELIEKMVENRVITDRTVADIMKKVDRGHYTSVNPYFDSPQGIGSAATISAPHMHAHAIHILKEHLKPGNKVLDVGSGSGYLCACFGFMVRGNGGKVIGIEHIPDLVKLSLSNLNKDTAVKSLLGEKTVEIVTGDGRKGYPNEAPFDAIHVGAAADLVPEALLDQLKPGGRMLIPVGPQGEDQYLRQYDKDMNGKIKEKDLMGVIYVPLTSKEKQLWRSGLKTSKKFAVDHNANEL